METQAANRVEGDAPSIEMPRYISQKLVHALRIDGIEVTNDREGGSQVAYKLHFADPGYAPKAVSHDWVKKHDPQTGKYLVVYKDGYESISPAQAFEDGNTPAALWGIPRSQEPKYKIGERGCITNRRTGKQVPAEEPLFILRAQDKLAMQTLIAYRNLVISAGLNPDSINERVLAFSAFAEHHPELMKLPNVSPPPRSEATPNPQAAWPFPTAAGG